MFKFGDHEKVIKEVRKHWFIIFADAFFLFFAAVIPLGLAYFIDQLLLKDKEVNVGGDLIYLFFFAYFLWLLGIWAAFFIRWTDYYLDVWYITDKRIIAVDQKGLFRREVIDLRYEKVQDATIEVKGIVATLLDFGDLHVQTAGVDRDILLKQAKSPTKAKEIILSHHSQVFEKSGPMEPITE